MSDTKPGADEVGIREARAVLGDLAHDAVMRGTVVYLTNRGRRVAALVPLNRVVCDAAHGAWKCNIHAGHEGRHTTACNGQILDAWEEQP